MFFTFALIGRNMTAQSTGSNRGIGGGLQIPFPEDPRELAHRLLVGFCFSDIKTALIHVQHLAAFYCLQNYVGIIEVTRGWPSGSWPPLIFFCEILYHFEIIFP